MKLKITLIVALMLSIATLLLHSCKTEDKCASIPCAVGYCEKGACVCPSGYSGNLCQDLWALKFVSSPWDVVEYYTDGRYYYGPYTSIIKTSTTDLSVLLFDNFWDEFNNVPAKMTSPTSYEMYKDYDLGNGNRLVSGQGTINELGTKITGSVTVLFSGAASPVTYNFVRERM